MLKLIQCEFWKLKRKKFILLVIAAAFLFPVPLTILITTPSIQARYSGNKSALFDGLFNFVIGYGIQFLLPCIIGIIAAMLFFMERDNNTFRNLRTIPVTSRQMISAKILVLFILSSIFCIASTVVTILCGMFTLHVNGIAYKLLMSVEMGIFITAGTLPLVVLIVLFSRSYIFSVLLCVFYSILSMCAVFLYDVLPNVLFRLMPIPLITFWGAGDMAKHNIDMNLTGLTKLIPSTLQVILTLVIMSLLSIGLIIHLYQKREVS